MCVVIRTNINRVIFFASLVLRVIINICHTAKSITALSTGIMVYSIFDILCFMFSYIHYFMLYVLSYTLLSLHKML